LKSNGKVIALIVVVVAAALAIIGCQSLLGGSKDSFNSLSAAELTAIVETMAPQQQRQLAQSEAARKELVNTLRKIFSLASAAQAEGLDKTEKFKQQLVISTDLMLAKEESTRNPQGTISKEEGAAYLQAHTKEFEADLKTITPAGEKKELPAEQVEMLKTQWAEMKIRAEKARQAGIDKEASMPLKLKLQRAQDLARAYNRFLQEKLKATPEEIKKHLQEHPEADLERIKKRAEDVLARIKKGEDFAALAKEFSDDPGSKEQGGELPWVTKGSWVPEFEQAAFAMQPGQTSELVKSGYGFHIIRVEDRRIKKEEKKDDQAKPAATPAPTPTPAPAQEPKEEIKARHILISTRDAEGVEQMLTGQKVERALQDASLKFPVNAPADFPVTAPGVRGDEGLKLPNLGGGEGGRMAPIKPNEKK
jgi:parvulin-like peptidyl-prolyl isomerase